MSDYFDMTGKVVLITGGSRGLGFEMAKGFAAQGADLVITSRKIDDCRSAAAHIESMGRRALAHALRRGGDEGCLSGKASCHEGVRLYFAAP